MGASGDYLNGKLLVAMPGMRDPRFAHALVYLCAHSADGAIGLIVNKTTEDLTLTDLFQKLDLPIGEAMGRRPVHYGGPVETGRGFVLHSADYHAEDATMKVDAETSMTATMDILEAMGRACGPRRAIVTLGYAGWAPGQLEQELQENGWLTVEADDELVFGEGEDTKWAAALAKLGIDPSFLTAGGGSA